MVLDPLSISAIIISLIVLVVVIAMIRRSEALTEEKIRRVMGQSVIFQQDRPARDLCIALHQIYPEARPGLDYLVECKVPGKSAFIKEWNLQAPQPTDEEIDEALKAVEEERGYQRQARAAG